MASRKDGNQASIGSKRFQNNVLSRSGDWICNTCGNSNFSFRLFCHKKHCNSPRRPSITPAPKDAQVTNHPSQLHYGGVVIPSAPPLSQFNYGGVAIPPKDAQVTNHPSQVNYGGVPPPAPAPALSQLNYRGVPTSAPAPAPALSQFNYGGVAIPPPSAPAPPRPRPLPPYGMPIRFGLSIPHFGHPVPTIPPGSFGGIAYSPRPTTNPYGYGFQGPPPSAAGLIKNNSASQKHPRTGPSILTKGNWICPGCMNVNYASRTKCNIKKCGAPKPKSPGIPDGSWTCKKCGNINYPFRTKCNNKSCRSERSASTLSQITSK